MMTTLAPASPLRLPATHYTPKVVFHPGNGALTLTGPATPTNAGAFFGPVIDAVKRALRYNKPEYFSVEFRLETVSPATGKHLAMLLNLLDLAYDNSYQCDIRWFFPENNLEMKEIGEDLADAIDLPVTLLPVGQPLKKAG